MNRRTFCAILPAAGALWPANAQSATPLREKLQFDHDWKFSLGDPAGAGSPGFDAAAWRAVDLPHDWSIEGRIDPNNPIVLNNLAFLLAESGDNLEEALTKATRAKQLLPGLAEISDTLGWIYLKKNTVGNAIEVFRKSVALEPGNPQYKYHLGMAYLRAGDNSDAKQQLEALLEMKPDTSVASDARKMLASIGN